MVWRFIQSYPENPLGRDPSSPLGHELHVSRIILLDLLCKGLIDANNVEIYTQRDRVFLYNQIFPNVFSFDQLSEKSSDEVIDLTNYMWRFDRTSDNCLQLVEMGYDINTSQYRTPSFIELCNRIEYLPADIDCPFVVIHFRFLKACYENNRQDLDKIVEWCQTFHEGPIVIFWNTTDTNDMGTKYSNLIFTNNLQQYASYMNSKHCSLVISEWSGGGQLSQYTTNAVIYFYFRGHALCGHENNYESKYRTVNSPDATIYESWDFKMTTNAKPRILKDLSSLLELKFEK